MTKIYKIILIASLLMFAFSAKADIYNGTLNTGVLNTGLTGKVVVTTIKPENLKDLIATLQTPKGLVTLESLGV